jgi:hypothetical protein
MAAETRRPALQREELPGPFWGQRLPMGTAGIIGAEMIGLQVRSSAALSERPSGERSPRAIADPPPA